MTIYRRFFDMTIRFLARKSSGVRKVKTKLEFVVNANWTVLFDTVGKKYYLLKGKQWLTAAKLEGPWTATPQFPKELRVESARGVLQGARRR
jgi:hypothetical protein